MAGERSSDFAGVRDMPEQGFRSWFLGGLPIITSPAEIDIANAHGLREALLAAGGTDHATVVLDMTQTAFCDSNALNVLVRARKRAAAGGGEVRLVIREASLLRIFAIAGIDRMFPIFISLPEALAPGPQGAPAAFWLRQASVAVFSSAVRLSRGLRPPVSHRRPGDRARYGN
jgi:anti-sigma B factor antagonist